MTGIMDTCAASPGRVWRCLPFCGQAHWVNDRKSVPSRLKKIGGGVLLAIILAAVCRSNRSEPDSSPSPSTRAAVAAEAPGGASSSELAIPEPTSAEPTTRTVQEYIAASVSEQEKALRTRWATNAAEPTLGKLISAAREAGVENDTVLGIKHCVDGLVSNDENVLGAFKDLGITDAHLMREPNRDVNDAIDICMAMMMAVSGVDTPST